MTRGDDLRAAPLRGLRIVECASFVAGPTAGLTLTQLGADVMRVDLPNGGSDRQRWPLSPTGVSYYWANLNRGKRSVVIDYRSQAGRDLVAALATVAGDRSGIFVDNTLGRGRIEYEELCRRRPDVIHLHLSGRADGRPAIDYTVNAESGVAMMTGQPDSAGPTNEVLPAWDLLTGMTAATVLLAALQRRADTGEGAAISLALADVAVATVGTLGWLAEASDLPEPRARLGNRVYGTFGADFRTCDGHRLMLAALTPRHWSSLCRITGTTNIFANLQRRLAADFSLESERYRHRSVIEALLDPWFVEHRRAEVECALDGAGIPYGWYRDMNQVLAKGLVDQPDLLRDVDQPGIGPMMTTSSPWRWAGNRAPFASAPVLGEHTEEVLAEVLDLSEAEFDALDRHGIIQRGKSKRHA